MFVVCGCAYCPVATQIGMRIDTHYAPSMWQCETSCERKKKQRILPEYPRFERRTDTANSAPGSSASNFRAPAGHRMYATVVQRYSASRTVGPTFPSQRKDHRRTSEHKRTTTAAQADKEGISLLDACHCGNACGLNGIFAGQVATPWCGLHIAQPKDVRGTAPDFLESFALMYSFSTSQTIATRWARD